MIGEDVPPGESGDAQEPKAQPRRGWAILKETAIVVALSLVIATVVRIFLVQAFLIPSESMQDTLLVDDRVMVSKISLTFGEVERGDVVVFQDPNGWLGPQPEGPGGVLGTVQDFFQFVGVLPDDSQGHVIKRVIGVGGDTVECCDDDGRLTVNGVAVDESAYLFPGDEPSSSEFSEEVPEGHVFVMGDHRSNSGDSRMNGTFSEEFVVGKAFAIVWPVSRWSTISDDDAFEHVPPPE